MTNLQKYNKAFMQALNISEDNLYGLKYGAIPEWDSLAHLLLINTIESTFSIRVDTDDVLELNSYEKGKETLKKYNVEI
jgi:acyl carrier protein